MRPRLQVEERVHIDADHPEWGRVASDATVVAVPPDVPAGWFLVLADSVRANIMVRASEVGRRIGEGD